MPAIGALVMPKLCLDYPSTNISLAQGLDGRITSILQVYCLTLGAADNHFIPSDDIMPVDSMAALPFR